VPEDRIAQGGVYALAGETPPGRGCAGGHLRLANVAPPSRVAQSGVYALVAVTAHAGIAQAGVYLLAGGGRARRARRRSGQSAALDGATFRFTSLDRDLPFGGQ
jgi:hypothetical protein